MALIPRVQIAQGQTNITQARTLSPEEASAPFEVAAAAALQASDKIRQSQEREQETQAIQDFSELQISLIKDFEELSVQKQNNPDGFTKEYTELAQKKLNEYVSGNSDKQAYASVMNGRFARYMPQITGRAIGYEAAQKTKVQQGRLASATQNYSAMLAKDPTALDSLNAQLEGDYAAAQQVALVPNAEERLAQAKQSLHDSVFNYYTTNNDLDSAETFLKEKGAVFGEDLDAYQKTLARLKEAQAKEQLEQQKTAEILKGNRIPDPYNSNDKKLYDKLYTSTEIDAGLQSLDEKTMNHAVSLVQTYNMIPESMERTLRAQMESTSQEQQKYAFGIVAELQEVAPRSLRNFSEKQIKNAIRYNSFLRSGLEQDKAIELITEANDPLQENVRKQRLTEANKLLKDIDSGAVENALDGRERFFRRLFSADLPKSPRLKEQALSKYRTAYEAEYLSTGDKDTAEQVAKNALQRLYGVSQVTGGKKYTQFPPEQHYGIQQLSSKDNAKWMQAQLKEDLQKMYQGKDFEEIDLVPTPDSAGAVENGGFPLYNVVVRTEDGYDVVTKNGMALQYAFDPQRGLKYLSDKKREEIKRKQFIGLIRREGAKEITHPFALRAAELGVELRQYLFEEGK